MTNIVILPVKEGPSSEDAMAAADCHVALQTAIHLAAIGIDGLLGSLSDSQFEIIERVVRQDTSDLARTIMWEAVMAEGARRRARRAFSGGAA